MQVVGLRLHEVSIARGLVSLFRMVYLGYFRQGVILFIILACECHGFWLRGVVSLYVSGRLCGVVCYACYAFGYLDCCTSGAYCGLCLCGFLDCRWVLACMWLPGAELRGGVYGCDDWWLYQLPGDFGLNLTCISSIYGCFSLHHGLNMCGNSPL
eukprot:gene3455-2406_t